MEDDEVTALRRSYYETYHVCQYGTALRGYKGAPRCSPAALLCVEHIWNRKGPHSEHWSNYALVCPTCHTWKHANSVEARVAISALKLQLSDIDRRHFDRDALRLAAGFDVPGWVDNKSGSLPKFFFKHAAFIMGRFHTEVSNEQQARPTA